MFRNRLLISELVISEAGLTSLPIHGKPGYSYTHAEFSNDPLRNSELCPGHGMPACRQSDSQKRMFALILNFVWKKRNVYMTCEMNPEFASALHLIID
jgi:hypothetical protein